MNSQDLMKSPLEDILIKKLLLSHDPDGRQLDSDHLLRAMENIMLYSTLSQPLDPHFDAYPDKELTNNIEVFGFEESLAQIIVKISHEVLCNCSKEMNLHDKTMSLFDLLARYRWGDKAVLAISGLVKSYGEFWLIMQQICRRNPLAESVAMLKQLPCGGVSALSQPFKALSLLMKIVVDLTKCVIKFEGLPLSQVMMDDDAKSIRDPYIYSAVYWILRSIFICSNHITDRNAIKSEQYSDSTTIATWELSSLAHKLKGMLNHLNNKVQECSEKSESKLYKSLLNIFKEDHKENQQVLRMLFALRDDFPLIDCPSQLKLGLTELENKVVVILVSKPELLPIEDSLLLIQQHGKSVEGIYETVWIPIPGSNSWTESEKRSFRIMSHSMPWCSIKQSWSLNPATIKFIRRAWNYIDEPIMVVLDSNGNVTNLNAMDMIFIWGPRAYPFSASREEELWKQQKWTLQFLVDEIDPLLTKWVEEERFLCIYGSNNMDWILELSSKAKEIENSGFKLHMVYVGYKKKKSTSETHVLNKNIIDKIEDGDITSPLSLTKMRFFWLRLESIRRSKLRHGGFTMDNNASDRVLQEVSWLIEMDEKGEDWALIGRGSSQGIVRVDGVNKLKNCLDKYLSLSLYEPSKFQLVDDEPCCDHSKIIGKDEEKIRGTEACEKCGHLMKKFVVYRPE